jgi:LmbE family N-acetylglucosaminyl deacetylase
MAFKDGGCLSTKMLRFLPDFSSEATILCLGAHCDDIEIGCGGTLVELHRRHPQVRFVWVVFSGAGARERETRAAATALLGGANVTVEVHDFRDSYFPHCAADIKGAFGQLRSRVTPDLVMTHYLADRHQDHRVLAELTWNTFRRHAILEYEIPKYEGDLAHPGVFVPLAPETVDRKVAALLECFPSQCAHPWFEAELFRGHLRLRGVECDSPTRYAEAFHARKILL